MTEVKVYGVGVFGEGNKARVNGIITREYTLWTNMLSRCYGEKTQRNQPKYIGCAVSEEFHNFSMFKEWCYKQVGFNNTGWSLDKDILVKGNKVYSAETCVFVPREINNIILNNKTRRGAHPVGVKYYRRTGKFVSSCSIGIGRKKHLGYYNTPEEAFNAYKQAKEKYIKEQAEKWKDKIDQRAYEALYNYTVDIDD